MYMPHPFIMIKILLVKHIGSYHSDSLYIYIYKSHRLTFPTLVNDQIPWPISNIYIYIYISY